MAEKTVMETFRLSREEKKLLCEKAKEKGMSESKYLRFLISQKPNDYPEIRVLIRNLINEVNHIGVNINQIVKNYNASLYSKEDKEKLFIYMRKLNVLLKKVVDMLGD